MKPFLFILIVLVLINFMPKAMANIYDCGVSVTPSSISTNTTTNLTFNIQNRDVSPISWVQIRSPDSSYEITAGSSAGFSTTVNSVGEIVFNGGNLAASSNQDFIVSIRTNTTPSSAQQFNVQVSDAAEVSPFQCDGTPSVAITATSTPTAPTFSSLSVTVTNQTQATVTWNTDQSSSTTVDYGLTTAYGSRLSNGTLTTSHSITLPNLTPNQTYHYKITSVNSAGGTTVSEDNTFTTNSSSGTQIATSTSSTTSSTTTTASSSPTPKPTPIPDRTPPSITISTDFKKPYAKAPEIAGKISDNKGVKSADYSLDGGKNWLKIEKLKLNKNSASFSFTPEIYEEDNYILQVRAFDTSGNLGYSSKQTLIIDEIAPKFGGVVANLGPLLVPSKNQTYLTLPGLSQKITLSSVGGATQIALNINEETYQMTKLKLSNLWSSDLKFVSPGKYPLVADAVDGAERKTNLKLTEFIVLEQGRILHNGSTLQGAEVKVFVRDNITNKFVLWDGKQYLQDNPIKSQKDGSYSLILPPGNYFIQVDSPNFKTLQTPIFKLLETTPINSNFNLEKANSLSLGFLNLYIPDFSQTTQALQNNLPAILESPVKFDLYQKNKADILKKVVGKKSLISVINSWHPKLNNELQSLEQQSKDQSLNVLVILPLESTSAAQVLKSRANFDFEIIADPKGVVTNGLPLSSLPLHINLDKSGKVVGNLPAGRQVSSW